MSSELELLAEIRDLLQVMAEPMLAKRDEKWRGAIRTVAGKGKKNGAAIMLMDGTRPQAAIAKAAAIDAGQLNRLVKALENAGALIVRDGKHPKLLVKLPPSFFDDDKQP
jgi:hypothetical protein